MPDSLDSYSSSIITVLAAVAAWKPIELILVWVKRKHTREDTNDLRRHDREDVDDVRRHSREDVDETRSWDRVKQLEAAVAGLRKQIERMTTREARFIAYYARRENRIITAFELALLAPSLPADERIDLLLRSRSLVAEALGTQFDDTEATDGPG